MTDALSDVTILVPGTLIEHAVGRIGRSFRLVADGRLAAGRSRDPVVEAEVVEGGREPDAPRRQLREPVQRHRLDPGDPGVVHERGGDRHHPLGRQPGDHALGAGAPGVAFLEVHHDSSRRDCRVAGQDDRGIATMPGGSAPSPSTESPGSPHVRTRPRRNSASQPVRVAGRRHLGRADGAEHGRQHQPAGHRPARRPGDPAGVPARGDRRAADRLRVRAAVPVLPARRVGLRLRGRHPRGTRGRRRRARADGHLRLLRPGHRVRVRRLRVGVPRRGRDLDRPAGLGRLPGRRPRAARWRCSSRSCPRGAPPRCCSPSRASPCC